MISPLLPAHGNGGARATINLTAPPKNFRAVPNQSCFATRFGTRPKPCFALVWGGGTKIRTWKSGFGDPQFAVELIPPKSPQN